MQFPNRKSLRLTFFLATTALAQIGLGPKQLPLSPAIQPPEDAPYRGLITIHVDATDTLHKIYKVHESLPVQQSGPMVLLYPQWESGSHAATGPIASLAGLFVRGSGRILKWQRDPVNVFAFEVSVPPGVPTLEVDFQYLSPVGSRGGAQTMTPYLLKIPWQNLMLYPAGYYVRDLPAQATLKIPATFSQATALETIGSSGDGTTYKVTTIERLADSPVYAGRYFHAVDLTPPGGTGITLDLFGDTPEDIRASDDQIAGLRAMVAQTLELFHSNHYAHYDLLVSLSDVLPSGGGLEHLESSEINLAADFFRNTTAHLSDMTLFPHEYAHSWNGLWRQPADHWTANFNIPMRDSLLWVYEGQTEFWALSLSARSGLLTRQQVLDLLALDAATAEAHCGREWKSLQDSNNDPIFDAGHSVPWKDWERREDYYGEGVLLWLDVDSLIRKQTAGQKSLRDFARTFFGGSHNSSRTETYTFDDICGALSTVAPYDWARLLRERLDTHSSAHLLDGLTRAGYRLIYTTTPTAAYRQLELDGGVTDLSYSIGLTVDEQGMVRAVAWNKPAFHAGLVAGARILSVNGVPFTAPRLQEAVAKAAKTSIRITYTADRLQHNATVDYQGTLRYPRLERIPGTADLMSPLFR